MLFELCRKQDWVSDWVSFGVSNDELARARAVWEMRSARAFAFSPERNAMILDYEQINGMKIMRILLMKSALCNAVLVSSF